MRSGFLKKIIACALAVCCALPLFSMANVFAASNIFEVKSVELVELSETASGNITIIDNSNIQSDITFQKLSDEAKIKITLKNTDEKDHAIESISDNNQSPYISYAYDTYKDVRVKAGETFDFIVTAKYQNAVEGASSRVQTEGVKFLIKYFDIDEPDVIDVNVPDTGGKFASSTAESATQNNVMTLAVLTTGIAVFIIVFVRKHKQAAKIVMVFAAIVTTSAAITTVSAETIETSNINVSINFTLYPEPEVEDVVTYDITSDAVKNYYANVNSWVTDEPTFFAAMKNNYDSNNCKATGLNPQTSEDFASEYRYSTTGNVFCDKPKGYDTEASGEIKVYISDENTRVKGAEATYVSVNNGVITNLIPGTMYYWESTTDSSVHGYIKATGSRRLVDLPTARNVRDLGGIKAADGKTIQYGRIMRGERLGDDDVDALKALGVDYEYDVRSEDNGSHFDVGYYKYAMMNYDIIDDRNYQGVRDALTALMNDIISGKNIYIHCTHGSDRTGTLAYLAEALLGVNNEDRDRDFDLTALSGRPDRTRFYNHMSQSSSGFNPERKYVYMKTELPDEMAVREWYFRGSTNRAADEQLIENFRNAILK